MAKYDVGEIVQLLREFYVISNVYVAWDVDARCEVFLYDLTSIKKEPEYTKIPEESLFAVPEERQKQVLLLFS